MRHRARHSFTFLGAFFAGICATLAMIDLVFAAFLATRPANLGALTADRFGKLRIAGHEFGGDRADQRAIPIEFDAPRHVLHILLLQTPARAMFAFRRACVACVDTALIFFVGHNQSFRSFCTIAVNALVAIQKKTELTLGIWPTRVWGRRTSIAEGCSAAIHPKQREGRLRSEAKRWVFRGNDRRE
jgi:hypothetical protein